MSQLAKVQDLEKLTGETDQALLALAVERASAELIDALGWDPLYDPDSPDEVITFPGRGGMVLQLPAPSIRAAWVSINGGEEVEISPVDGVDVAGAIVLVPRSGLLIRRSGVWPQAMGSLITVRYQAGWSSLDDLPYGIQNAVLERAILGDGVNFTSETIGPYSRGLRTDGGGNTRSWQSALDTWGVKGVRP